MIFRSHRYTCYDVLPVRQCQLEAVDFEVSYHLPVKARPPLTGQVVAEMINSPLTSQIT